MNEAWGQRGGVGRRARRRGRLLESLGGTVPWSALEHIGAQGGWGPAHPPHPNLLPGGQGPERPRLVRWSPEDAAVETRVTAWERQLRALPRQVRRALQRHFVRSLAELALLLALWQGPAWAVTIPVDGTTCTLVDAITAANTDTATGGCPAGSGADTLVLSPGSTLTLMDPINTPYGPTGLPVVSSVITIAGQGSTLGRAGGGRPVSAAGGGGRWEPHATESHPTGRVIPECRRGRSVCTSSTATCRC
jgi:hypothetical protein